MVLHLLESTTIYYQTVRLLMNDCGFQIFCANATNNVMQKSCKHYFMCARILRHRSGVFLIKNVYVFIYLENVWVLFILYLIILFSPIFHPMINSAD